MIRCLFDRRGLPFLGALCLLLFLGPAASIHASGPIRLVFDGQINLLAPPNVGSPSAAELDLQDRDPIQVLIEFDQDIPLENQFGQPVSFTPSRFEVQLDGQAFLPAEEAVLQSIFLAAEQVGSSGVGFSAANISVVGELNGISTGIGLFSAIPDVVAVQTGDIGFDGSVFPSDFGFNDVTDLSSPATLAIFSVPVDPVEVTGPIFNIDFTGLSVTAVPEPSAVAITLFAVTGVAARQGRRRR